MKELNSVILDYGSESQKQIDMTLPLQMLFDDVIQFVSFVES